MSSVTGGFCIALRALEAPLNAVVKEDWLWLKKCHQTELL